MSKIFVKKMTYVRIKGKLTQIPIYGNFCLKCNTSSDDMYGYDGGLVVCTKCNHVFTVLDVEKSITEFWKKKKEENITGLDAFL